MASEEIVEQYLEMVEQDAESLKHELLYNAMEGNWEDVVDMYKKYPWTRNAKLTRSGETALHIAVIERKEGTVKRLVELVDAAETEAEDISPLMVPNERGNTPLHLAASIGNTAMCECMYMCMSKHLSSGELEQLLGHRNTVGETPLFLAALHGQKNAFHYLDEKCGPIGTTNEYARRADGETILHVAISGEYFDLAYDIILKYRKLIYSVNGNGYTPLHVLASKPAVFTNTHHLSPFSRFISHFCLHVKKLTDDKRTPMAMPTIERKRRPEKFRDNNKKSIQFFQSLLKMLKKMITIPVSVINRENLPISGKHMEVNKTINLEDLEDGKSTALNLGKGSRNEKVMIIKFISRSAMSFGGGFVWLFRLTKFIEKLRARKEKNIWSLEIMKLLLQLSSSHKYDSSGGYNPGPISSMRNRTDDFHNCLSELWETEQKKENMTSLSKRQKDQKYVDMYSFIIWLEEKENVTLLSQRQKDQKDYFARNQGTETPILLAAKNGITKMVMEILEVFPTAILDKDSANKNIVHLAVENRQTQLYKKLVGNLHLYEAAFRDVDNNGNNVLHLAATFGDFRLFPFAALEMQWEDKWYKHVKASVPRDFFLNRNNQNKTPREVFRESHEELVKQAGKWLAGTSNSCSVVATLVTTVAFATTATVPGGMKGDSGIPNLERHPGFKVFTISSLVALSFSITSVIAFLSILTSRYDQEDFRRDLPKKLLVALTTLFMSLAAMLVCFCAGHFFLVVDELKHTAYLVIYAIACLPVAYFAIMHFPFYRALIIQSFTTLPRGNPFKKGPG